MLPCQKCGYDNELGRIFCHQCGTKLDLDAIKPVSRGGKPIKSKKGGTGIGVWIRRIVGLGIFGVVAFSIYLMCQVPVLPGKPEDKDVDAGEKKYGAIEKLVQRKKPGSLEITAGEMNGYLSILHPSDANVRWGFVPEQIWVETEPKLLTFHLLMTMHVGDLFTKKLCLTWTGEPVIKNGQIQFVGDSGKFGELSWPNQLINAVGFHARLFGAIVEKLPGERDVLSRLSRVEVRDDRVIVSFEPH